MLSCKLRYARMITQAAGQRPPPPWHVCGAYLVHAYQGLPKPHRPPYASIPSRTVDLLTNRPTTKLTNQSTKPMTPMPCTRIPSACMHWVQLSSATCSAQPDAVTVRKQRAPQVPTHAQRPHLARSCMQTACIATAQHTEKHHQAAAECCRVHCINSVGVMGLRQAGQAGAAVLRLAAACLTSEW